MIDPFTMIVVFFIALAGGAVGSIAGGAALFEIPALLLAGIPIHSTIGTFKLANVFGTSLGVYNYARKGHVDIRMFSRCILPVVLGSLGGGMLSSWLSKDRLEDIVFVLLGLALIVMFIPVKEQDERKKNLFSPAVMAVLFFFFSIYGGFMGAGLGTIFILLLFHGQKMPLVTACGTGRTLTLSVELVSVPAFLLNGHVEWMLIIPLTLGSMAGSFIGSSLAIKKGSLCIRPIMFIVIAATLAASAYNKILP